MRLWQHAKRVCRIAFGSVKSFFLKLFHVQGKAPVGQKPSQQKMPHDAHGVHHDGPMFVERTKPPNFVLSVLSATFKGAVVIVLLAGIAVLGALVGLAKAYMDSTPDLDIATIENQAEASFIYDCDGELITSYTGVEYREWASIEEIPQNLQDAYIAIEDIRFFDHSGIDIKRLFGAFVNNIFNESVHGGSTITQQLVKNRLLTSERSYKRKIQEAYLAYQLEQKYSKEEILEAYLNTINLGDSNYGVKTAAMDFFGKDLKDLTLLDCATLAGLTQNPYSYNPRKNFYTRNTPNVTLDRAKLVLQNMYTAGMITEEEYEQAKNDTLQVIEKSAKTQLYDMPYFVEYAVSDVVTRLLEEEELPNTRENRVAMENKIRTGGYKIYTTVDRSIQEAVEISLAQWEKYPKLADPKKAAYITYNSDGSVNEIPQPQAAAVVYDYHNGQLKAIVGGRYAPTRLKETNRATISTTSVGSSIKPLAVYGPALDKGMSPASVINNIPTAIPGWNTEKGYPAGGMSNPGPVTMREAIRLSLNVVSARVLLDYVTIEDSVAYLEKLGIDPSTISATPSGLALGSTGISTLDMAVAYGAIANSGTYIRPVSFTKILDRNDRIILDTTLNTGTHSVFKASTAWLLTDMLTGAVQQKGGTGTKAQIKGMTVAGKTGTLSDYCGVFFAGYTPYYSSAIWIGHDNYEPFQSNSYGGDYAAPLWQNYMSKIHEGLADKKIIDATPESLGLKKVAVCSFSGLLATEECGKDTKYPPVTDYFLAGTAPTKYCNMHISAEICSVSGKVAIDNCPAETVVTKSLLVFPPTLNLRNADLKYLVKRFGSGDTSTTGGADLSLDPSTLIPGTDEYNKYYCTIHTQEWHDQLVSAQALIASVEQNIEWYGAILTAEESTSINQALAELKTAVSNKADLSILAPGYNHLKEVAQAIFDTPG
ncbi:MAG: transglycosylase domain-containing protein [Christensenellales bacterium]